MTYESALKVIQEAEKHSDIYTKINITVKKQIKGGVRSILIPTKDNPTSEIDKKNDDTNGKWKEVRNTDEIYENILEQNTKIKSFPANSGMPNSTAATRGLEIL